MIDSSIESNSMRNFYRIWYCFPIGHHFDILGTILFHFSHPVGIFMFSDCVIIINPALSSPFQRLPSRLRRICVSMQACASAKAVTGCLSMSSRRHNSGKAPEKIECFIDGKKVLVDPGTTVLQVNDEIRFLSRFLLS